MLIFYLTLWLGNAQFLIELSYKHLLNEWMSDARLWPFLHDSFQLWWVCAAASGWCQRPGGPSWGILGAESELQTAWMGLVLLIQRLGRPSHLQLDHRCQFQQRNSVVSGNHISSYEVQSWLLWHEGSTLGNVLQRLSYLTKIPNPLLYWGSIKERVRIDTAWR